MNYSKNIERALKYRDELSAQLHKANQQWRILDHLIRNRTISPLEALEMYGCYRLGARIYDLRQAGIKIKTIRKHNDEKSWAEYRLEEDD
ncbi:MAG: hypothetical protein J6Y26_00185 [Lachnospiraceae bacterium]|nr:hypothetical protein [Lachnospiraceae bacterium]